MKQSDLFEKGDGAKTPAPKPKRQPVPKATKRKPTPITVPTEKTDRDSYIRAGVEDWNPWDDDPEIEHIRLPWWR
jgi:hypothetical protein